MLPWIACFLSTHGAPLVTPSHRRTRSCSLGNSSDKVLVCRGGSRIWSRGHPYRKTPGDLDPFGPAEAPKPHCDVIPRGFPNLHSPGKPPKAPQQAVEAPGRLPCRLGCSSVCCQPSSSRGSWSVERRSLGSGSVVPCSTGAPPSKGQHHAMSQTVLWLLNPQSRPSEGP